MARVLILALVTGALLAGCTETSRRSEHLLAEDLTVSIGAGDVWQKDFTTKGGRASFDFALTDNSKVDIGFMRTQNVATWANGSVSNLYGGNQSVSRASNSVDLEAGQWSLVIRCDNTFADCDGIIRRASYFSA